MAKNVIGAEKVMKSISQLPQRLRAEVGVAIEANAQELVRIAKVLIPVGGDVDGDGHERDKITSKAVGETAQLVDFGPKSKVIEGESGPRPFVNPALSVSRKRRANRAKRAVKKAVRQLFNG